MARRVFVSVVAGVLRGRNACSGTLPPRAGQRQDAIRQPVPAELEQDYTAQPMQRTECTTAFAVVCVERTRQGERGGVLPQRIKFGAAFRPASDTSAIRARQAGRRGAAVTLPSPSLRRLPARDSGQSESSNYNLKSGAERLAPRLAQGMGRSSAAWARSSAAWQRAAPAERTGAPEPEYRSRAASWSGAGARLEQG